MTREDEAKSLFCGIPLLCRSSWLLPDRFVADAAVEGEARRVLVAARPDEVVCRADREGRRDGEMDRRSDGVREGGGKAGPRRGRKSRSRTNVLFEALFVFRRKARWRGSE